MSDAVFVCISYSLLWCTLSLCAAHGRGKCGFVGCAWAQRVFGAAQSSAHALSVSAKCVLKRVCSACVLMHISLCAQCKYVLTRRFGCPCPLDNFCKGGKLYQNPVFCQTIDRAACIERLAHPPGCLQGDNLDTLIAARLFGRRRMWSRPASSRSACQDSAQPQPQTSRLPQHPYHRLPVLQCTRMRVTRARPLSPTARASPLCSAARFSS